MQGFGSYAQYLCKVIEQRGEHLTLLLNLGRIGLRVRRLALFEQRVAVVHRCSG